MNEVFLFFLFYYQAALFLSIHAITRLSIVPFSKIVSLCSTVHKYSKSPIIWVSHAYPQLASITLTKSTIMSPYCPLDIYIYFFVFFFTWLDRSFYQKIFWRWFKTGLLKMQHFGRWIILSWGNQDALGWRETSALSLIT